LLLCEALVLEGDSVGEELCCDVASLLEEFGVPAECRALLEIIVDPTDHQGLRCASCSVNLYQLFTYAL